MRCSPGEDATNGFFVSLFVRDTEQQRDVPEVARKRKTTEDEDCTSQLPAKRKKKKKKNRAADGAL